MSMLISRRTGTQKIKSLIMFLLAYSLLSGCVHNVIRTSPVPAPPKPESIEQIQTITLQYRTSLDAVAPSQFVALYHNGMTMGLKIHWKLPSQKRKDLDALLARLERERDNGREFTARARWIHEGFELEVYEIEKKF